METTLSLRNRLGFNEVTLWKQFCARRLHLIHTLSLNLRKASEQEEQVRVLAAELCAEYGYGPYAQSDFEKLLIAGIQSVRRNQKRSARHPNGFDEKTHPEGPSPLGPGPLSYPPPARSAFSANSGGSSGHALSNAGIKASSDGPQTTFSQTEVASPSQIPSDPQLPAEQSNKEALTAPSDLSGGPLALSMFQSLVARLEVLRDMIGAASAHWIESSAPTMAYMSAHGVLSAAVAAASVHGKLSTAEATAMRDSMLQGPLLESLRLALNPSLTQTRLLERIGALAASLVHGPFLLSALQALCVSLAQASHGSENDMRYMLKPLARADSSHLPTEPTSQPPALPQHTLAQPPPIMPLYQQPLAQMPPVHPMGHAYFPYGLPYSSAPAQTPQVQISQTLAPSGQTPFGHTLQPHSQPIEQARHSVVNSAADFRSNSPEDRGFGSVSSTKSNVSASTAASSVGFHVTGPDRLVTLQYNDKLLQLTFSPMKATPPTISEIIDNARVSFSIPAATVVRIKDAGRNKIIETNSELIDAFTQAHVRLELLLPPPMMIGMDAKRDILGIETKFTNLAPIFRKSC